MTKQKTPTDKAFQFLKELEINQAEPNNLSLEEKIEAARCQSAYDETGLNSTPIDWRYWVHQMPQLSAAQAACLMSALDPDLFVNLDGRPGNDDPTENIEKARKIQRLAEAQGKLTASPAEWVEWAKSLGINVHIGFLLAVWELPEAIDEQTGPQVSEPGISGQNAKVEPVGIEATGPRAQPITREEILSPLLKALDATIYQGRVKGEKRLGYYKPNLEEVRIKKMGDIEVAAHEIAHLLDDRIPEIKKAWLNDKPLRDELRSISYDSKKINEGFAEGVRLWMTQPEALEAKAPKVFNWIEGFAKDHQYGPALKTAQEGMVAWFAQDGINRARSKIGQPIDMNAAFDGIWDRFRQSTVDDLHGVMRMEQDLTGKLSPVGAYESARLSRASQSIADGSIRNGYPVKKPDGSFTFKGKGLEEILKPLATNLDNSLLYFVGKSAAELTKQGREHLFTPGEIDAMLRLRTPERDAAFKEYQTWNKGILDFAEAQGVINPDARAQWQRTQPGLASRPLPRSSNGGSTFSKILHYPYTIQI